MTRQLRLRGKTYTEFVLDLGEKLESLEQLMNQHAILLDAVLDMLEKGMVENSTTNPTTSNAGYDIRERKL